MAYQEIYRRNKARAIAFLGGRCVECGSMERLEFDHIGRDRPDDKHCITQMLGLGWDTIMVELKKCQLLCRTHHLAKTKRERAEDRLYRSEHGSATRWRYGCRCEECREANKQRMRTYHQNRLAVA